MRSLIRYLKQWPLIMWLYEQLRTKNLDEVHHARLAHWGYSELDYLNANEVHRLYIRLLVTQRHWEDVSHSECIDAIKEYCVIERQPQAVLLSLYEEYDDYISQTVSDRCW